MTAAPLSPTDDLPDSLRTCDQWLCWREKDRDGKATKIPIDPATGQYASATDPETWGTYQTACEYLQSGDASGLGFVFTDEDPFVGVDLDSCRHPETGRPDEWAKGVVSTLESYTEVSPSGTGYHVLLRGEVPAGGNRSGDIEIYDDARFFTVTGDHVEGTPTTIEDRVDVLSRVHTEYIAVETGETESTTPPASDGETHSLSDEELLERARSAKNGEKFARLWRGETTGYDSHSEADMALCSMLSFWTGGDASRVDTLVRRSGLYRQKWDDVHYSDGSTYGEKTVERAIAGTSEFYDPGGSSQADISTNSATGAGGVQDTERSREIASAFERETETELHRLRAENATHLETIATLEARIAELERKHRDVTEQLATELARSDESDVDATRSGSGRSGFLSRLRRYFR